MRYFVLVQPFAKKPDTKLWTCDLIATTYAPAGQRALALHMAKPRLSVLIVPEDRLTPERRAEYEAQPALLDTARREEVS